MAKEKLKTSAAIPPQAIKANARGEIDLGFRKFKIKVSLGAMAAAEDEFGCDFSEIEDHLGSTKNIAKFIAILARAAGEEVSDDDIKQIRYSDLEIADLMARIGAATGAEPGNAPAPRP